MGLGFAFGARTVVSHATFALATSGMHILMGPSGSGKSALVRSLAGLNDAQPSFRSWGICEWAPGHRGVLVRQHHHLSYGTVGEALTSAVPDRASRSGPEQRGFLMDALRRFGLEALEDRLGDLTTSLATREHRTLGLFRACLDPQATVVLVDEPMGGLADDDAREVSRLLGAIAETRAVLVVTHHQARALDLGGTTFLLSAGMIRESAPTAELFAHPATEWGRRFVESRGPHDAPETPPEQRETRPAAPTHFCWLLPGQLGGLPRPGVVRDLDADLDGLAAIGVTTLVCLEESSPVPLDAVRARGMKHRIFPIPDMGVPTLEALVGLLRALSHALEGGEVVALHCLAGLGRTGLVLAAYLLWSRRERTAAGAIEAVRSLRSRMVQTIEQEQLLREFQLRINPE